jgi:hypothetical protein
MKKTLLVSVVLLTLGLIPLGFRSTAAQQVVYTDDMSNPLTGLLSEVSPNPSQYSYDYKDGKFIAQAVDTFFNGEIFSFASTPDLFDSITAVDVGIGGADERQIYGFVGCRAGASDEGYLFLLEPTTGRAALWRQDATGPVLLAETFVKHLVTPGVSQFNRIEIDCYLDLISASVNGEVVLAEFDDTYAYGLSYVGVGNDGGAPDNLFGVFDNLTIIDQTEPQTGVAPAAEFLKAPSARLAGPLSGSLVEQASSITTAGAGVNLSDFFATASFVVPADVSVPWDITIGFRDAGLGNEYRLSLFSTGEWRLSQGSSTLVSSGFVSNLLVSPGQVNTVDLLVEGWNGAFALNGVDVSAFDVSASTTSGDVWLTTANVSSTTQVGRATMYSNFEVWATA